MAVQQIPVSLQIGNVAMVQQFVDKIMKETGQKWRDVKRKNYNVYACKLPKGYVYANKLEQPESYKAIMQKFNRPIVPLSSVEKTDGAVAFLQAHGCYLTDGNKITLCGTQGEMWDVKPEKFVGAYKLPDGAPINLSELTVGKWFTVSRAGVDAITEVGLQVPNKYYVQLVLSWGKVYMNNPNSSGHFSGDILVFSKGPDGKPNLAAECSPINNAVFALTVDQTNGGWGRSGLIVDVEKAQANTPKLEALAKTTEKISGGSAVGSSLSPEVLANAEMRVCVAHNSYGYRGISAGDAYRCLKERGKLENEASITLADCKDVISTLGDQQILLNTDKPLTDDLLKVWSARGDKYNFGKDFLGLFFSDIFYEQQVTYNPRENMCHYYCANLLGYFAMQVIGSEMLDVLLSKEVLSGIRGSAIIGDYCYATKYLYMGYKWCPTLDMRIFGNANPDILAFALPMSVESAKVTFLCNNGVPSPLEITAAVLVNRNTGEMRFCLCQTSKIEDSTVSVFDILSKNSVPLTRDSTVSTCVKNLNKRVAEAGLIKKLCKPNSDISMSVYTSLYHNFKYVFSGMIVNTDKAFCDFYHRLYRPDTHDAALKSGLACPIVLNMRQDEIAECAKNATPTDDTNKNTRLLHMRFDAEKMTIAFRCQFEGAKFDKVYKLTKKTTLLSIVLMAYMNICNVLHVHPGKTYFSNKETWNCAILPQVSMLLSKELPKPLIFKCLGVKTKDYYVFINLGIYSADTQKQIGTRVLRVELNYEHFDVKKESNASTIRGLQNVGACTLDEDDLRDEVGADVTNALENFLKSMSIKLAFQNMKLHSDNANSFIDFKDVPFIIAYELKFLVEELISTTKKYGAIATTAPAAPVATSK